MQATMGRRPVMRRKGDSKRPVIQVVLRGSAGLGLLLLFVIKEVVITHGLFLRTFFRPSISATPPPIKLDIGYWNKLQFKAILILRYLAKDQFAYQSWMKRVHDRILHRLEASGAPVQYGRPIPIATVRPGELEPREFWKRYVRTGTPVIIKGGAADSPACQRWTPEYFASHYGDFKVNIIEQNSNEHSVGSFADVVASEGTDRKLYIHNSASIFSYNPELFDDLDCLSYTQHMGGRRTMFLGAQLFLGVHPTTGTEAHSASNTNLFFQVYGKKKWTFVHPDYLWLMYPALNRFFLFCASFVRQEYTPEYLEQYAPLQRYCPRYEAVLEPGDILLNPPWQWHAINNVTDRSIGVATRWTSVGPVNRTNTFFDLCQLLSPAIWRLRIQGMLSAPGEPVIIDENTRGLVDSHDDYIDFGKKGAAREYMDFHQWPEQWRFTSGQPTQAEPASEPTAT
ncbi:cupin-like domain-containing protein [uncultured Abyssibacter sp.]|uniref:cupin-like domain-containing protein n=1 Tax=uncultured Abyssibacter sp. TaxID=2320202 RepID=UPI0032B2BFDE